MGNLNPIANNVLYILFFKILFYSNIDFNSNALF